MMKFKPVKQFLTLIFPLFITTAVFAQTEFFSSKIAFTETQLEKFNSAFTVSGNYVIFNANDYTTYCYNKKTEKQVWLFNTNQKSNTPPGPAEIKIKTGNNKLLLHTDMEAGQGGASGRFKALKDRAREYAFLFALEGITK